MASAPNVIVDYTLYFPGQEFEADSDDAFTFYGQDHRVVGHSKTWPWMSGGIAGTVVEVVRAGKV
ncbi:MAG: hypothetical protein HZY75_13345 [Nocardioidaceae bacterium]|nr:MAG: hypothetical protein HZY75_13345 [Nocardioidaceae bacterium]